MAKIKVDVCDLCDEVLVKPRAGLLFEGENISVKWAGRGSPDEDPLSGAGSLAPLNGRVCVLVCKKCLTDILEKETES